LGARKPLGARIGEKGTSEKEGEKGRFSTFGKHHFGEEVY